MAQHTYVIKEEATYRVTVEIPDDMDPEGDDARELAEQEFCGLEDQNDAFQEVSEREVSLAND